MITMTNGEAFEALVCLQQTAETGVLGYALAKNRRRLSQELAEYMEARDAIINKYAIDGDKGREIPAHALAAANKELAEYTALPCKVEPYTVPLSVFTGGGLTSAQMYTLDFIVEEDNADG